MSNSELKKFMDSSGKFRWPTFIPKKFCKKMKNKKGEYFYIVSFVSDGIKKEAFIPFSFLKEHISGAGYYGHIQVDMEFTGRESIPTKINSSEFLKYFPPEKMPRTGRKK